MISKKDESTHSQAGAWEREENYILIATKRIKRGV